MQNGYWVELDWDKLRSLNGAAKLRGSWFPRRAYPSRACEDASDLEQLKTVLTMEGYRALGIKVLIVELQAAVAHLGRKLAAVDNSYVVRMS